MPGASAVFRGGVVSYATDVKVSVLGVPQSLVDAEGVVSAACAAAMASGVRRVLTADVALATTGVAGPDRQEDQPVGTVFVAVAWRDGVRSRRLALAGDRAQIQAAACAAAVDLLGEWSEGRFPVEQPGLG